MFIHTFDTLKFPVHQSGIQDTLKQVLGLFLCTFPLVMPVSHAKLMTSLNLLSSTYCWQSLACKRFYGTQLLNNNNQTIFQSLHLDFLCAY